MPGVLRRLVNRLRYRRHLRDLEEELACHREMKTDALREAGRAAESDGPGAADAAGNSRDRALAVDREMGNVLRAREQAREVWVPPSLDSLRQDLGDARRFIVRRPGFTAAAVAALVVSIGAATIVFSLLNALVLRPLPVERPDQLVYLRDPSFSYPIFREVRARSTFFESSFAWNLEQFDTVWGRESAPTLVLLASGTIHDALGVRATLGRGLVPADEGSSAASAQAVGVLSYGAWQRRFGGDPQVIGRVVRVQRVPITIVGVTPPQFFGVAPGRAPEITLPVTLAPLLEPDEGDVLESPGRAWLHVMGRLRPGTSLEVADAQFQVVWPQVLDITTSRSLPAAQRARFLARRSGLEPGARGFSSVRNQFQQPLVVLAGLAGLLLLVGCTTVATMLVAGAWGRSRELAVRLALGCSRARLARQIVFEGLALAAIAGLGALIVSTWASTGMVALLTTSYEPVSLDLHVDWRLGVFTATVVAFAALAFSAGPVLLALAVDPGPALKAGSRQVSSQGGRAGRALVGAQVAFSVTLLVGAALLLRSLGHLVTTDAGFDPRRLVIVPLEPPAATDSAVSAVARQRSVEQFYRSVFENVSGVPSVESIGFSMYPPLSDEDGAWTQSVAVDDGPIVEGGGRTFFNGVSPNYFATVGTRLLSGRDFTWADTQATERVVIVNRSLAERFFPGQSPIGRRITIGRDASRADLLIVGVVSDSKYQRLQEPARDIAYVPFVQGPQYQAGRPHVATIRLDALTDTAFSAVRDAIVAAAPTLSPRVVRVSDRIRESLVTERLLAMLAAVLAGCALFLACAGLFGLMSQMVVRRTREIGIRLALGARSGVVLREVLRQSLVTAGAGVVVGSVLALGGGRWLRGLLYGIGPTDPTTFAAVALLTLAVAVLSTIVPARRAATVDPVAALRAD